MSSDPLPLPEIWSDLPDESAAAGARGEFAVNGHSGLVLIEYASGYAQSGPQPVVGPHDRVDQPATSERLPSLVPAALAKGLADLTAIVTQAEALLRVQGALKGDVHFAVERIHDVAMALRMRDVDAPLCDTLEASVREVGDAVVRHEAAATGALSAAALLRDVMRRIEDLTIVASRAAAADALPPVRPLATEAEATTLEPAPPFAEAAIEDPAPLAAEVSRSEQVQPQLLSAGPEAEAADGAQAQPADPPVARLVDDLLVEDQAHSLIETALDKESSEDGVPETQAFAAPPATAPEDETADRGESPAAGAANDEAEPVESQAIALANDEMAEPAESPAASAANDEPESVESQAIALANDEVAESAELKAIAALNDEAAEPIDSIATAAAKYDAPAESIAAVAPQPQQESRPQQESNAAPTGNEPEGEAANAAFAAETAVPVVIEARGEQEPPQRASSLSVGEGGNAAAPKRDRPANDPLAALYGLSEEELIAVFC